ncbi:hypothetical protein CSKR_113271 [Clonorchis sinensis]|uniref:Rho-GAP domain-containing protein n=1 Tax=Clonorchis sinensis TaxID=79923 RepID=A0A3R7H8G4_CLOSI|nr:hypothetical protein CSKR_113271 [Clonorchis sinensis]
MRINMDPVTMELVKHGPAYPMGVFPSTHLDLSIVNPTVKVHEFRCRFPSSFLALITNYLGYLIFSPEDTKEIQNALIKEAKASRDNSREHSYARSFSGCSSPAQRRRRSSRTGGVDKELEHWYTVVHTLLLYLLENKRYKQRFILRRPGNQSNMNELERKLFPPRLNIWICSKDQTDELVRRPAMVPEILSILRDYDTSVLASVLARVLRPHGVGLIPCYLRSLFLQLVSNTMESEIHQRRAIRLLFQLVPTRLLRMVIRPVFELLAGIANEPTCEVDEYSLAVLFSPILFLDQSTTTPASLANPLPARAVELLVRTALRDLQSHQSLDRTFRVPVLFQKDCMRNLTQHMIKNLNTGTLWFIRCYYTYWKTSAVNKQRFILRRPGNQSNMNELERKLFPPRLNIWICSKDQTDELVRRPAMVPEILSILRDYDTSVLASVLARVLRPHGVGLIPCYLRSLFLQLVSNTMESEIHQRRAIRLLFQLVPTRLLRMVIRPVFELLAGIANEPTCEVDEYSLAVLFSPILFLDQSTTTPASLANPLPARAVELLVRTALRDLQSHQSLDRTFRVPVLFQKDCMRNLTQHMVSCSCFPKSNS